MADSDWISYFQFGRLRSRPIKWLNSLRLEVSHLVAEFFFNPPCYGGLLGSMRSLLRRMLISFSSTSSASAVWLLASGVDLAWIIPMHHMQARASARGPVTANAAQAVGFMCCNCDGMHLHLWIVCPWNVIAVTSHTHFPGSPMRRPQQLQVIIIHWTMLYHQLIGANVGLSAFHLVVKVRAPYLPPLRR